MENIEAVEFTTLPLFNAYFYFAERNLIIMEKTGNVEIKSYISNTKKIELLEYIVNLVVGKDENDEPYYRPYLKEYALQTGVAIFLIDGIKFDSDDNFSQIIFSDEDVMCCVKNFIENYDEDMSFIMDNLDEMIEFKKQCIIHSATSIEEKVLEILEKEKEKIEIDLKNSKQDEIIKNYQISQLEYWEQVHSHWTPEETAEITKKMAEANFDADNIGEIIASQYFQSDTHKDKLNEIIESDKKKIAELKKYKVAHDSRNVLNK